MCKRMLIALGCMMLLGMAGSAAPWNKKTILTVNEPIQIPGTVLEPGKYVIKLVDSLSNRHIVQITNEEENQVITTVLAIPNYRLEPTGDSQFQFWETPVGNPKALRAWFYPGDNFGQEFAYPKGLSAKIAAVAKAPVPTTEAITQEEMKTAPVRVTEPSGREKELVAEAAPPPPRPAPVAEPAPRPTPAPEPAPAVAAAPEKPMMPETASPFPMFGMAGLALFSAGLALRFASRVR